MAGKVALDSGLSTGGFTDCLLQYGASFVYGVDVGYGQVMLMFMGLTLMFGASFTFSWLLALNNQVCYDEFCVSMDDTGKFLY